MSSKSFCVVAIVLFMSLHCNLPLVPPDSWNALIKTFEVFSFCVSFPERAIHITPGYLKHHTSGAHLKLDLFFCGSSAQSPTQQPAHVASTLRHISLLIQRFFWKLARRYYSLDSFLKPFSSKEFKKKLAVKRNQKAVAARQKQGQWSTKLYGKPL